MPATPPRRLPPSHLANPAKLTPREEEILGLYRAGSSTKAIAESLCQSTVASKLSIAKEKACAQ